MAIYIPPVGTKATKPTTVKPVVLPSRTLGAAPVSLDAFRANNGKGATVLRATEYTEAAKTGIELDIDALLAKHPLPPTPTGKEFVLDPWQIEDIGSLVPWTRVGVFLPVGAGKTVISTLVNLAWNPDYTIVLVLPILVPQWVEWINSVGNAGSAAD